MNIELLKKLIRLANNNPNEHEANAAARRACKMVAEDNFALLNNTVENLQDKYTVRTPPEARTWDDVKRSTEPEFKSRPPSGYNPSQAQWDYIMDLLNRNPFRSGPNPFDREYRGGQWSKQYDPKKWDNENPTEPIPKQQYHPDDAKYYERRKERGFGETKFPLKCKTCGNVKLTLFMGLPEMFECNSCQWTAYERNKDK